MRGVLVTLSSWTSCLALFCSSLTLPAEARAEQVVLGAAAMVGPSAGQAASAEDPRVLYEEGRKAYRLGDFEAAVEKWERAYALSDKPLLLYNISLAYKGRYTISRDISDLRRSKAILDNFIKLAQADPELDLDDAPERMSELEQLIAKAEEEAASGAESTTVPDAAASPSEELRDMPEGEDPGRKLRIAGIASMGTGGGFVLVGAGVGIYFLIRSQQETTKLRQANEDLEGCLQRENLPDPPVTMQDIDCFNAYSRADTARDNGNYANRVGYITVGVLGGIGLVGLIAGAVMFTEGNRRSRRWEQGIASRIQIMPTRQGLLVKGRF